MNFSEEDENEVEYLEDVTNWFDPEGTGTAHNEVVKTENVGGLVHEGDIDFENLYGEGDHHEVIKTESVGGLVHEGDIDFENLYGGAALNDSDFGSLNTAAASATEGDFDEWAAEEQKVATGAAATISSHYTHGDKEYEINEFEPLNKQIDHAVMVPYNEGGD